MPKYSLNQSWILHERNVQTVPLSTSRRGTREHDSLALPEPPLQQPEDHLIVDDRERVMHAQWVGSIVEDYVCMRDPLSEIGLWRSTFGMISALSRHNEEAGRDRFGSYLESVNA